MPLVKKHGLEMSIERNTNIKYYHSLSVLGWRRDSRTNASRSNLLTAKVELQNVRGSSHQLIDGHGQSLDPFSDVPVLILTLKSLAVRLK